MRAVSYSPVLSSLPEAELRRLLRLSSLCSFRPSDPVVIAGEHIEKVFLVTDGVVKIVDPDESGRETIVGLALTGDLLADAEALGGHPPLFDAIAGGHCSLIALDRQEFVSALAGHPEASLMLARTTAERAHSIARNAMDRTKGSTRERIAGRLLDLAETLGRMRGGIIELELPMSREELGHLAGMCRESATRALGHLRTEGVVTYKGRSLKILRPERLETIRNGAPAARPSRSRGVATNRPALSSLGI